ncbi:hypothetical protein PY254_17840 [Rhodanobacter sp. AS-Z3]|uniref:hypothetical protein n=1 Tax=Rhodanobacter sp. AS-Z3 TaxID=3031330 RepID=UPI00247A1349|nr:hypothetical protein [Rhodanobacter sp. AS-Z3]WEN15065.1 hypothetical protein PY254_17840 [Rhodanobacter sp. AS-Z3]
MSIGWTLLGTFGQLVLAYLLFMLVAFSGGGLASNSRVSPAQMQLLDWSLFALPGSCALSAAIVSGLHWAGGSARCYGWYALPLAAAVPYFSYLSMLTRQIRNRR